jgi:predicted CXXCH cytochrome family protein
LLLKPDGAQLCLACHSAIQTTAGGELLHPPDDNDCLNCHHPHQSRVRSLLRDDEDLLICSQCHKDFLEASQKFPYRHRAFDPRSHCGNCHYAHQRDEQFYLRENVSETCLTCHDLPIQVRGRQLVNIARRLRESQYVHQAIDRGCPTCHTPHGSPQPSLLKEGYPAGQYEQYRSDNYALCWQCHNSALAESSPGAAHTNFRAGAENLHRLHVIEVGRGRACHLCHHAHASDQLHLMRQQVRFQQWLAPMEWKPLPDGGSCVTPCHRPSEYHRSRL